MLAERALADVLSECGLGTWAAEGLPDARSSAWNGLTFGALCEREAAKDLDSEHCQERAATVLRQLRALTAPRLEGLVEAALAGERDVRAGNAVANFLVQHLAALRIAARGTPEALRAALEREAVAQIFLGDAFSSAHMFLSIDDPFAPLHPVNNRRAHDFYAAEGAYVINGRGRAWVAFGDGLLEWFAPSFERTLEGSRCSLREVFLAYSLRRGAAPESLLAWAAAAGDGAAPEEQLSRWLETRDGSSFYAELRMPSLLEIPFPVSAAWTVRTERTDEHGIHVRLHYPQLRGTGLHDPDLRADRRFLPDARDVPDWLVAPELRRGELRQILRNDTGFASVAYHQARDEAPSYEGLVSRTGVAAGDGVGWIGGLGYGLLDNLALLRRVSLDVIGQSVPPDESFVIGLAFGAGFKSSMLPLIGSTVPDVLETVRFESGYAWGVSDEERGHGFRLAPGIETRTFGLGFTCAGFSIRIRQEWIFLDTTRSRTTVEVVIH